jgi:hypothetical protein
LGPVFGPALFLFAAAPAGRRQSPYSSPGAFDNAKAILTFKD